jgi:hypothetical protein
LPAQYILFFRNIEYWHHCLESNPMRAAIKLEKRQIAPKQERIDLPRRRKPPPPKKQKPRQAGVSQKSELQFSG